MIVYFADRKFNIIGQASTNLPKGLMVTDDTKDEDVESGVAIFECEFGFDADTRAKIESCVEVGNYILRKNDEENEFYTIIDSEVDTKNQTAFIYAEDAGLDLLNEIVGAYEADKAYPITHYVEKFAYDSGFVIGINEVSTLTRKLSWDGEATVTERLASVATQFDGCEISFSFDIERMQVTKKKINIFKQRGKDIGTTLHLNKEIDNIVIKKTIVNVATALRCTGGTLEDTNTKDDVEPVPITLRGYKYDDGDFYVDGDTLKCRSALKKWSRYINPNEQNLKEGHEGHIVRPYSYDTTSQATLCAHAVTELKKLIDAEVNYEADILYLPKNTKIGDRVNIVDEAGELFLSTRLLQLKSSAVRQEQKATLGEFLIKKSGISDKVAELAKKFAQNSQSAARALAIAKNATANAEAAQELADTALSDAEKAAQVAAEAAAAANTATQSAQAAQAKADNAQAAVDIVEESVAGLETTVANAQAAADQAWQAAQTADAKATEAQQSAVNAQAKADEAATAAGSAQSKADSATTKAEAAQSSAEQAIADAEAAATTAAAAKLDAENAQKDIDALGDNLTTLSNTMSADYARKTDLTEAEASLQSQISQNAEQISSTVSRVQTIDETANNAQEQAQAAQTKADEAQTKANQAATDAQAAQTAADEAAAAATAAQSEADTAKAAAATAQSVADKAEADLEAAKADLATVSSRVDSTEEEIAAAQQAVTTAQAAADKAKADAATAAQKATAAQSTADTAVTNAATAKQAADEAADKATIAQATANEAKGNAATAQATADEAKATANAAQATANTAKANAENAQAKADQAAADAATAQRAADDADAKAAQAASDLATAQQNLANVTSRVDATAEEVAAAQAAVEAAQAAADKAKADAATAQSTANTAKANADSAQQAANQAKTAADNAQAAADAAQQAADDAQAAVDSLAVRVTKTETDIVQTNEQISLLATKKEVTQTLGGYYTKEEADAAITVKADAISSSVSKQFEELQIGGRNLLLDSETEKTREPGGTQVEFVQYADIAPIIAEHGFIEYTISFDIKSADVSQSNTIAVYCQNGNGTLHSIGYNYVTVTTDYVRHHITVTPVIQNEEETSSYLAFCGTYGTGNIPFVKNVKIEKGNKATDWTPAPEDVAGDIENAQNTADSAVENITAAESTIQQLADSIAALVRDGNGGSLLRQDSNGLWYFNIGEIEKNISDTANELADLSGLVFDANGEIDVLKSTAAALQTRTEYVRSYTDENDQPCLELGEGDSIFKVRITNTEIQFAEGTAVPAKLNRKMLIIEKAMVKNELQFGDDEVEDAWIWKRRSNGNLGLSWKGVDE